MATLVINRDSISVTLESNHLVVHEHADGSCRRVPLVDIERVIVVGQPAITFPVFVKLLDLGIPCSFLTHGGRWRGMMDGDCGFHAARRMLQYERARDSAFLLRLSRQVVAAKIANSRRTIQRLASERKVPLANDLAWRQLSCISSGLAHASTSDAVRGFEGMAANVYFSLLARFFPADAAFGCRSRRPPLNPANALLSFVYSLLTGTFASTVRAHGLDVACGFFHRVSDRSPSLALDLMEPFRPAWADRLVLNLLNHRRICADKHFGKMDEGGFILNESGRSIVFRAFDEMMASRQDTDAGLLSRRQIIEREVCRFIAMLESKAENVIAFYRAA